ncbi:MAG: hypothetical protein ABL876_01445 [Chitinophagaceae bacterium]
MRNQSPDGTPCHHNTSTNTAVPVFDTSVNFQAMNPAYKTQLNVYYSRGNYSDKKQPQPAYGLLQRGSITIILAPVPYLSVSANYYYTSTFYKIINNQFLLNPLC